MHRYASVEEFERLARKPVRNDPFADGNRLPVSSIKLDAPILHHTGFYQILSWAEAGALAPWPLGFHVVARRARVSSARGRSPRFVI